jgi:hypothetical protein
MHIAPEFRLQDVMITCPVTQQALPTGVQITPFAYATSIFSNVRVVCPHCEGEHRWGNADAYLVEVEHGAAPLSSFGRRAPRRVTPTSVDTSPPVGTLPPDNNVAS